MQRLVAKRRKEEGADTIVWLASEGPQDLTGKFLRDRKEIRWWPAFAKATAGKSRLLHARRNGFVRRSWPIVVGGPWPASTVTSSPSGNSFSLIPLISRSILPPGKSPRPMLPAKRTS